MLRPLHTNELCEEASVGELTDQVNPDGLGGATWFIGRRPSELRWIAPILTRRQALAPESL